MNYFELFEMPITLRPEQGLVKKKFYELSRRYHPDFFTGASDAEQSEMLEKSSMVNQAFKIFQNEDATIKYLLLLKNTMQEEEKYQLPQNFLMDVMDINEQLMENTNGENTEGLSKTESETKKLMEEIYQEVKPIIEQNKEEDFPETDLLKLKDYYYKKKYLQRILGKIDELRNIAPR